MQFTCFVFFNCRCAVLCYMETFRTSRNMYTQRGEQISKQANGKYPPLNRGKIGNGKLRLHSTKVLSCHLTCLFRPVFIRSFLSFFLPSVFCTWYFIAPHAIASVSVYYSIMKLIFSRTRHERNVLRHKYIKRILWVCEISRR